MDLVRASEQVIKAIEVEGKVPKENRKALSDTDKKVGGVAQDIVSESALKQAKFNIQESEKHGKVLGEGLGDVVEKHVFMTPPGGEVGKKIGASVGHVVGAGLGGVLAVGHLAIVEPVLEGMCALDELDKK